METTIVYWGNIGIMENKMETTIMENQMEKKMENEMETTITGILGISIMNAKFKPAHQKQARASCRSSCPAAVGLT